MATPLEIADQISLKVDDTLNPLERAIKNWPLDFRAIIWRAVAMSATRRVREIESAMETDRA